MIRQKDIGFGLIGLIIVICGWLIVPYLYPISPPVTYQPKYSVTLTVIFDNVSATVNPEPRLLSNGESRQALTTLSFMQNFSSIETFEMINVHATFMGALEAVIVANVTAQTGMLIEITDLVYCYTNITTNAWITVTDNIEETNWYCGHLLGNNSLLTTSSFLIYVYSVTEVYYFVRP